MKVNGKHYPMWGQFVERKNEFIGGLLQEIYDCGFPIAEVPQTKILDIELIPNGEESAFFRVIGKDLLVDSM